MGVAYQPWLGMPSSPPTGLNCTVWMLINANKAEVVLRTLAFLMGTNCMSRIGMKSIAKNYLESLEPINLIWVVSFIIINLQFIRTFTVSLTELNLNWLKNGTGKLCGWGSDVTKFLYRLTDHKINSLRYKKKRYMLFDNKGNIISQLITRVKWFICSPNCKGRVTQLQWLLIHLS